MPDQDMPLHRVRGFTSGVNWRVTKFAAPVPHHITCGLCQAIPRTTFLLPCLHSLCELCVSPSADDGSIVCPFDEESFASGDCRMVDLPPATADRLKACCWNEAHGCTFVGTLQAVLAHYEQECTFHAVTCPRCNGHVIQQDLPRHYREGCHGEVIASTAAQPSLRQGLVVSAEDIGRCLDDLKALIINPYQDRFPALQSKMNEVLEEARNMGTHIEAITRFCRESERRLTQALGDLSTKFAQEIQSQQSKLCTSVKKHFLINEISEQVRNHGMKIDAIARILSDSERRLSDQLAEAKQELSSTFSQKLERQERELFAKLETISELERSNQGEVETTGAKGMPWRLEKRHILRKLELIATDSITYLESLRTCDDQQLKRPIVEYTPLLPGYHPRTVVIPPLTGKHESIEEGYIASITNIEDLRKSSKIIFLFTAWYRRDRYLQVAAHVWPPSLIVCLKWGTTEQGACSAYPVANVYVEHPDCSEQKFHLTRKYGSMPGLHDLFGFNEIHGVGWQTLDHKKIVRDGKLTLVVSFRT